MNVENSEYVVTYKQLYDVIINIWSDVLGVETSRIHDDSNFFNLGGTSSMVMQFCLLLEQQYSDELGSEGVDLSTIVKAPDLQHFVQSFLKQITKKESAIKTVEGEL